MSPYLQVEIYRPGSEIRSFAGVRETIAAAAAALGPIAMRSADEPLVSKFGPLSIVSLRHVDWNAAPLPRLRARL